MSALLDRMETCIPCQVGCNGGDQTPLQTQEPRNTSGLDESALSYHAKKDSLRADAKTMRPISDKNKIGIERVSRSYDASRA
jgi:hypothetical protein